MRERVAVVRVGVWSQVHACVRAGRGGGGGGVQKTEERERFGAGWAEVLEEPFGELGRVVAGTGEQVGFGFGMCIGAASAGAGAGGVDVGVGGRCGVRVRVREGGSREERGEDGGCAEREAQDVGDYVGRAGSPEGGVARYEVVGVHGGRRVFEDVV